jgi:hypothetical protein
VNVLSGTIDTGLFDNIAAEAKELFVSLIRSAALANPAKSQPPPCPWHRTIRRWRHGKIQAGLNVGAASDIGRSPQLISSCCATRLTALDPQFSRRNRAMLQEIEAWS